jgi:hypothetical protein
MNASQDQGGPKHRRMGHPVQVAQNRRKKNAQQRRSKSESKPPEPTRVIGDARDKVVKNILREQDAQFQKKFGSDEPKQSLIGKVTVYLIDGMEANMEEQKKRQEESFDKFVAFCRQLFNRRNR